MRLCATVSAPSSAVRIGAGLLAADAVARGHIRRPRRVPPDFNAVGPCASSGTGRSRAGALDVHQRNSLHAYDLLLNPVARPLDLYFTHPNIDFNTEHRQADPGRGVRGRRVRRAGSVDRRSLALTLQATSRRSTSARAPVVILLWRGPVDRHGTVQWTVRSLAEDRADRLAQARRLPPHRHPGADPGAPRQKCPRSSAPGLKLLLH